MIERRRLPSATYYSPGEEVWSRELFANQLIAVHSREHDAVEVARHVADRQVAGAPFFVMNVPAVMQSVKEWNMHLSRFQPHYALRCNADPVLARLLADSSAVNFEVTNNQELQFALELVPASRVLYSNPLWTRKSMRMAGASGVAQVVVSNEKELYDAVSFAPDARILIAVSLCCPVREEVFGTAAGCCSEEAETLLVTATEIQANFAGFSFNIDNSDPGVYYKALREVRRMFDISCDMGLCPDTISVGGGFRYPNCENDKSHFLEVCHALRDSMDQYFPSRQFPNLNLVASPGRFFASAAFTLCTNVVSKRAVDINLMGDVSSAHQTAFVYQTNEGIYGSFGCRLADCDPQCRPLNEDRCYSDEEHVGTVLGPTLDGVDVAQRFYVGRQLSVGEWLLWENMGAYSIPLDPELPSPPVYYFAGRDNWERIVNKRVFGGDAHNLDDCASDGASDLDSVSSDDDVDLITCFDTFFDF